MVSSVTTLITFVSLFQQRVFVFSGTVLQVIIRELMVVCLVILELIIYSCGVRT